MKEFTHTKSAAARRSELFRGAVQDAQALLDEVRAVAPNGSAQKAVDAWRGRYPGLAALLDYSEGADPR